MYENFRFRGYGGETFEGYIWKKDDPAKVICIVHGIGEYGGRFDRVAERFREAGMAVAAFDLRGHGGSPGKKGDCAPRHKVLGDVSAFISHMKEAYPGKDIVLYGHSMGGNIVLDYRCRGEMNGEMAGYIVTAPWIRLVRAIPSPLYRIVKLASCIAPSLVIGSQVNEGDLGHPDSVRPYRDDPMVHNRISLQCAVDGFETGLALENGTMEDNGRADNVPLLLMHGEMDRICSVEGSRRAVAKLREKGIQTEYVEWPGLFHEIHNGGPDSRGDEVIAKAVEWALSL